jgi:hypothetical protein
MIGKKLNPKTFNYFIEIKKEKNMSNDNGANKAAVAGAAVGGAGAIGAVAASGSVIGLGATGITSGLAAIGGVVGFGMATGLAITVASPLAIGAAAYGLFKWLKD